MFHVEKGLFYRYGPTVPSVPLVVDVSRSGREYPTDMRSPVSFTSIHDNVSMYVDEIWEDTPKYGGTMLYALFPHMYIDANRHELDLDEALLAEPWPVELQPTSSKTGLGLLKSKSRYGEAVQEKKFTRAEVEDRMDRYYRPYHRELKSIVDSMKAESNTVYHLSCHCMSAVGAPTHRDAGQERADFCLGNISDGEVTSSTDFIEFVAETIRAQGFTCTVNTPYSGGEINRRHGDPENGVESILFEINKSRFMDVDTFRKTDGFDAIKNGVNVVLETLASELKKVAA